MVGNNEDVFVVHQPVKAGVRYGADQHPDYDVFSQDRRRRYTATLDQEPKHLFVKESVGHSGPDCTYQVFPDRHIVRELIATFLFREPVACWNSWKKYGFGEGNIQQFIAAYSHVFGLYESARSSSPATVVCLTYEHWMSHSLAISQLICSRLQITFADSMIRNWVDIHSNPKKIWMHEGDRARIKELGHDVAVRTSSGLDTGFSRLPLGVPDSERELLNAELGSMYAAVDSQAQLDFGIST